ncbi:hypothetical protein CC2G_011014 [Coprinopsis cinerea AmutBmut pab1-1]|nr:hypothetical protein CC2G_011014 [Coprinopsis cinerea AmutBmut pab1-1]
MTVHRLRDVHSETSWVGDVLTHAPGLKELDVSAPVATGSGNTIVPVSGGATPKSSTPSPRVHTSLECLSLGQDRKWTVEEMRGWVYPALKRLELLHHPFLTLEDGAPGADIDIVGEILAMVQLSKCRLEHLDLRYMGLPNEELVRLLVALPDLKWVELWVAEEVDENLFTMLRERSAGDESVLPRLECLGVRTCMWPMHGAKHTFDAQSFVDFVEDPRRMGGGPFAKIQRVCLMFDEEVKYIRS